MSTTTVVLHGNVARATPGAIGFDCDTALTAASAQAFAEEGFTFVVRYVSLSTGEASGDLTASEAEVILASSLALMAVQHVPESPWVPSQSLGQEYGQAAVANAQSVGLPKDMNLWLDLEGVASGTAASIVTAYCNAWFAEVQTAGYLPGLYVGSDAVLNGEQLYQDLTCQYYWQSGSSVPMVATRGYCMVQTISSTDVVDGVSYDKDVTQTDNLGNTPVWLAPIMPTS